MGNIVKWIKGNPLQLAIPLQKVTVTQEGKVEEPYVPQPNDIVIVELKNQQAHWLSYTFRPISITDNVVVVKDDGCIDVGRYDITVLITETATNTKRRSKWKYVVEVFDDNAPVLDEFDDFPDYGSGELVDAAVFFYAKGDKGDPGEAGIGIADGGTTGQFLQKKSDDDYDTEWADLPTDNVLSVNGKTGDVILDAEDVGALPSDTPIPEAQIQSDWNQSDNTQKDFIKNKPDLTIYVEKEEGKGLSSNDYTDADKAKVGTAYQKPNGGIPSTDMSSEVQTSLGKANTAIQTETDPTVPSWAKQSSKPSYTSQEVGALPISTKYGYSVLMSIDSSTYILTLSLKDQDGTVLNTQTVDLPLESVVVNGSYDSTNKKIILTLQSGSTIDVPVGDLIAGLQTEITSVNMLDADLVDDTNSTHKFVTAQEKTTWNNKSDFSGSYNDLTDKPTIPVLPTNVSAFTNDAGYLTQHQDISGKADKSEMSVVDGTGADADKTTITLKSGTSATVLKTHQDISGKQDVIDSSHKLSADYIEDGTTNKVINVKPNWNASSGSDAEILNKPSNLAYISPDSGVGIVPTDGIRAQSVNAGATISVNPDVVTVVSGAVGTSAITLQVPNDNLAHVWDILMATDSTVAITFAMSNSATILTPSGFAVGASKNVEISVIGVGTKYYLRYGEFA